MNTLLKLTVFILLFSSLIIAKDNKNKCPHEFTILKEVAATPVKSQGSTGTCWAFATTSFIESELLRMGKGEYDISEMWTVRNCYIDKAARYIRYHGTSNFSQGGQSHDVMLAIKEHGIVPENVYSGKTYEQDKYNHSEMESVLKGMLDGVMPKRQRKLTPVWNKAFASVLDEYLGSAVSEFEHEGVVYNPTKFADELGINPDDYVEFTSYSHHPFYEEVILEIPDNWTNGLYYNVPLDDLISIIDNALNNGYSITWDGDTGRDHFLKAGYAVIPFEENEDDHDGDKEEDKEKQEDAAPEIEKEVSQEMRQEAFDSFDITDDHLMHIVGLAENQEGTPFYYTKNSWGTEDKGFDGYWYMSEQYLRLKTVAILVHKDAVPEYIKNKINLD